MHYTTVHGSIKVPHWTVTTIQPDRAALHSLQLVALSQISGTHAYGHYNEAALSLSWPLSEVSL